MVSCEIGDKIIVTEGCGTFYEKGDVGVVVEQGLVDFNNQGNARVYLKGVWRCSPWRCELVSPRYRFQVSTTVRVINLSTGETMFTSDEKLLCNDWEEEV